MPDHTAFPDYNLEDSLELTTPEQFQALAGKTRPRIMGLIGQRAATTNQLAQSLGLPKGTVGHHLKVLESAGLIRVVRTRQVRAITEKYYGLVARTHRISSGDYDSDAPATSEMREMFGMPFRQALIELAPALDMDDPSTSIITHARIPASLAREFAIRLEALSSEFRAKSAPGERIYGFAGGIYLTDWPDLPGEAQGVNPPGLDTNK